MRTERGGWIKEGTRVSRVRRHYKGARFCVVAFESDGLAMECFAFVYQTVAIDSDRSEGPSAMNIARRGPRRTRGRGASHLVHCDRHSRRELSHAAARGVEETRRVVVGLASVPSANQRHYA